MTTRDYILDLYDGTTTVTLTTAPYKSLDWPVAGPARSATTTESLRIRAVQAVATTLTDIRVIETMFEQARQRWEGGAPRLLIPAVYLRWTETAAGTQYRSEILEGQVDYDPSFFGPMWLRDIEAFTLVYTRLNFFEGPEDEIALENGNEDVAGTQQTGGLEIFNNNEATGAAPNRMVNHVLINAAEVVGDLPSPCRIEIINTVAGTPRSRNHYIGHSVWPTPASLDWYLEAEDGTGGVDTADVTASGDVFVRYALTDTEATAITWAVTEAQLDAFGSNWYVVLMRLNAVAASTTKVRLKLQYQSTTFWQQEKQTTLDVTNFLQEIGIINFDPNGTGADRQPVDLILTATRASAANLDIDYLMFMPLDGYRKLVAKIAYGIEQSATLVDDMITRPSTVYVLRSSKRLGDYYTAQQGAPPIMLYPGRDQLLLFAWDAADGTALPARTATARLYYRPRRRTI